MEVKAKMVKTRRLNHYWVKYGVGIAFVIAIMVGGIFLVDLISPYLKWFGQYGYLGIFLGAFLANATIIFPAPFMSIIFPLAIGLASQTDPFSVSVIYALGATFGEGIGYIIGRGETRILNKEESLLYRKAEGWLNRHGKWAIVVLSLQPIFPFDIVATVAGALKYPWWQFLFFCFLGRIPKYLFIIGGGFEFWKLLNHGFG